MTRWPFFKLFAAFSATDRHAVQRQPAVDSYNDDVADWFPSPDEPMRGVPAWAGIALWLGTINALMGGALLIWLEDQPVGGSLLVVLGIVGFLVMLAWRKTRRDRSK